MYIPFNTSIAQWALLQQVLLSKKIQWWNVTNQWKRTEYNNTYPTIPYAMILLQYYKPVVILVWGNSRFKTIETRHTINQIITQLS
jgi:hypothetical protein